jgi:very-short-patch-repair endonuclease
MTSKEQRKITCQKIWKTRRQNHGPTGVSSQHYKDPKYCEKQRLAHLKRWQNPTKAMLNASLKIRESIKNKWVSNKPEDIVYRQKQLKWLTSKEFKLMFKNDNIRKKRREKWLDPNYVKKVLEGLNKTPSSFEKKIIKLISKFSLPFEYTGAGKRQVGAMLPDFMSTNKEKLIIETYYSFWHKPNYEENRTIRLKKYGYKVLFLNEHDIDNKNWEFQCLTKIIQFLQKHSENWILGEVKN